MKKPRRPSAGSKKALTLTKKTIKTLTERSSSKAGDCPCTSGGNTTYRTQ